jgi:two-component system, chemotaxis family, sensor kinase CheA
MDGMDEIIGEFLVESNESLDRLDRELIELEADPASRELLASIFRTVHTVKGTAGFLGFGQLEVLTHAGENLLSLLRDGKLVLDGEMTSALLSMVDAIRSLLAVVERTGSDADFDSVMIESLAERLDALAHTRPLPWPSPRPRPRRRAARRAPTDRTPRAPSASTCACSTG